MKRLGFETLILGTVAMLAGPACTGLSFGENRPGADTYLEDGSIAVDPLTETVYVLRRTTIQHENDRGVVTSTDVIKHLFAVDPEGEARLLADVSDLADLRMLFPRDQVLLMGEQDGLDTLRVLDPQTGAVISEHETGARYHGTRLSPSGRFVAVANNAVANVPIELIDTLDYRRVEVPHDGVWLEAMWANGGDVLVAMVDYERGWGLERPDPDAARMRFLAWDIGALAENGFPKEGAFFADPLFDVEVDGVTRDSAFSFSWVGVSPTDGYAAFPVRAYRTDDEASEGPGGYEGWHADLLIVDMATGSLRQVANAFGPVGFTPDGSTIVSYRYAERLTDDGQTAFDASLVLLDTMTLDETSMPIPLEGGPSFFVTREGHWVVLAAALGNEELVLYDLDSGAMNQVSGARVGLGEFVSRPERPELWLVDGGQLLRLDLMSAQIDAMAVSAEVAHINILVSRDELVLGTSDGTEILFFDPEAQSEVRSVMLPAIDTRD